MEYVDSVHLAYISGRGYETSVHLAYIASRQSVVGSHCGMSRDERHTSTPS